MNNFLKFIQTADDFNAISHALYNFFNSATLTRNDYIHLVNVLTDKFPIYDLNGNLQEYKNTVLIHAQYNYPPCADYEKAILGLLTSTPPLSNLLLYRTLFGLREILPDCNDFVGVEVINGHSITSNSITQSELNSIKKIVSAR